MQDESYATWAAQPSRRLCIGKKDIKSTDVKDKLTNRKNMILVAFICKPKCFSLTVRPQGKTVDSDVMVEYLLMTGKRFLRLTVFF